MVRPIGALWQVVMVSADTTLLPDHLWPSCIKHGPHPCCHWHKHRSWHNGNNNNNKEINSFRSQEKQTSIIYIMHMPYIVWRSPSKVVKTSKMHIQTSQRLLQQRHKSLDLPRCCRTRQTPKAKPSHSSHNSVSTDLFLFSYFPPLLSVDRHSHMIRAGPRPAWHCRLK